MTRGWPEGKELQRAQDPNEWVWRGPKPPVDPAWHWIEVPPEGSDDGISILHSDKCPSRDLKLMPGIWITEWECPEEQYMRHYGFEPSEYAMGPGQYEVMIMWSRDSWTGGYDEWLEVREYKGAE